MVPYLQRCCACVYIVTSTVLHNMSAPSFGHCALLGIVHIYQFNPSLSCYNSICYGNISTITLRHEMFHCLHCFINTGSKSGQHRTVDYFEDDNYYVKSERDTPSNGHHIKSQVFRNRNFDSGGRSFSNEGTRFGSRSSQDRGSNRSSRPYVDDQSHQNRFSDDLILKVNSGDIGRIIGMLNKQ